MNKFEYKNYTSSVSDIDLKGKRVTGYLSSFGNKDYDGDIIQKGAFAKSILERKNDIFFLNQHNWAQPHGKFEELIEDNKGLYFVSSPLIDTTYSMDTLKLYEAGIIKEHSIGFNTIKDEVKEGVRIIKEVKLYEGSNVTLGANSQTPFEGFKSYTPQEIKDETKKLLKAFRNGTFTDETFGLLEIAIMQLLQKAIDTNKNHLEPSIDTPQPNKEKEILTNYLKKWN